jgi:GGDEF domain-containing protein
MNRGRVSPDRAYSLVLIDISHVKRSSVSESPVGVKDTFRHIANQTFASLRSGDVLFRRDMDGFVVFLNDTSHVEAVAVSKRIWETVIRSNSQAPHCAVDVLIAVVTSPQDGTLLNDLIEKARLRLRQSTPITATVH